MSESVPKKVEELILPLLEELQLELVEVEFKKEGKNWFLRVYIDKKTNEPVDLDDCALASEKISEKFEGEDPIEQAYYLEVSSPGAERPLKKEEDLIQAIGKYINVTLYAPIEGSKVYEGTLTSFENQQLVVEYRDKTRVKTVELPYDKVAKARLAVKL